MNHTDEVTLELQKIPWFQDLEPEHLRQYAEISTLRHFKAGEVFFHEGDKQDYYYVVLNGRVALDLFVPHHGKVRFYTCEPWDDFGWSSVTPIVRTRTAGAIGVMDGTVIATDTNKLQALCDRDHDIGYLFMHRMTNVIASRLMVTRLQLLDMFAKPAETKVDE
ncbi:MAG: Crp/Fnr family transcriptional regulator [Anaerolineales bacterium]|jgi:CRP-like cAMP-binding protein